MIRTITTNANFVFILKGQKCSASFCTVLTENPTDKEKLAQKFTSLNVSHDIAWHLVHYNLILILLLNFVKEEP